MKRLSRLGWGHLWHSWSARLLWLIIAAPEVIAQVDGLHDALPVRLVQGLGAAALLAKMWQNRSKA